jgi:D-sedoheptulose 7-phosphate isomerase
MNAIDKIYEENTSPKDFSRGYLDYLSNLLATISEEQLGNFIEIVLEARERQATIFFVGNGGSAATASHFSNDISIGTRTNKKHFKTISLTDNVAVMTAIGNDYGYDHIFTKQLEVLFNPGDVVVGISASGNSQNILNAMIFANEKDGISVGLTGFSGGKLKDLAQHNIHVQTEDREYGPVEDVHMIIDHLLGNYLIQYCREKES